ncbi:hypothetical protein HAZT_HAZT009268 [Hyalella azteca]|uniref:Protein zntD n=1 Tax=Hyalella azteca TaxID=294128 RepID=A0A6A0H5P5_HYAAZ|nr:protein zntD [Hyalella azteca]KAA0199331.1 hypothetical protein HAZT_HAZT009268 [Hyalella azteca]
MDLLATKSLALTIMFFITIVVGLLPIKVRKLLLTVPGSIERSRTILSAFLCFGAGVLFGTTFLHILPEALENVETAQSNDYVPTTSFGLGEFIFCCGFFFMYIVEEIVHAYVHKHSTGHSGHSHEHHLRVYDNQSTCASSGDARGSGAVQAESTSHSDRHELQQPSPCSGRRHTYSMSQSVDGEDAVIVPDHGHVCPDPCSNQGPRPRTSTCVVAADFMVEDTENRKNYALNLMRSIFVIMALSVHGCLEGFSLGVEATNQGVWLMFGALMTHKIAIAFSIGMELLEKEIKTLHYVIYIVIFSVASPVGGMIGAIVYAYSASDSAAGQISIMVLQGMSGGTIMYVIFCEILERERCKNEGRFIRMLTLILGFLLMAVLELVAGEPDDAANTDEGRIKAPSIMFSRFARDER